MGHEKLFADSVLEMMKPFFGLAQSAMGAHSEHWKWETFLQKVHADFFFLQLSFSVYAVTFITWLSCIRLSLGSHSAKTIPVQSHNLWFHGSHFEEPCLSPWKPYSGCPEISTTTQTRFNSFRENSVWLDRRFSIAVLNSCSVRLEFPKSFGFNHDDNIVWQPGTNQKQIKFRWFSFRDQEATCFFTVMKGAFRKRTGKEETLTRGTPLQTCSSYMSSAHCVTKCKTGTWNLWVRTRTWELRCVWSRGTLEHRAWIYWRTPQTRRTNSFWCRQRELLDVVFQLMFKIYEDHMHKLYNWRFVSQTPPPPTSRSDFTLGSEPGSKLVSLRHKKTKAPLPKLLTHYCAFGSLRSKCWKTEIWLWLWFWTLDAACS